MFAHKLKRPNLFPMNIRNFLESYESLETEQLKKELLLQLKQKLKLKLEVCLKIEAEEYSALELMRCLSNALYETNQFEQSKIIYEIAKKVAAKINDKNSIGDCLMMLGNIYQAKNKFGSSISYLTEAGEIYRELDNKGRIAVCLAKVGLAEFKLSNHEEALSLYLEAINIMQDIDDSTWVAYISNSIGVVFERLNDNENAKKYYNNSLTIFEEIKLRPSMAIPLNNLANMALKEGKLEAAMQLHQQSLEIENEQENFPGIFVSLNNIAILNQNQEKYIEAIKYAKKALQLKQKHNLSESSFMAYKLLSEIALDVQQLEEAENYLKLAEESIEKSKFLKEKAEITELKVKLSEQRTDYKQALLWQKKLTEYQKRLSEQNRELQITEIHDKYLLEIKEKEAVLFKAKNNDLDLANLELVKVVKEKSEALALLKESEEKYRNVVERANEMIVIIQDRKVVFVNKVALDITGYTPEDLIGKGFMDLVPNEEKLKLNKRYHQRMDGIAQLPIFNSIIIRKDGKKCFIEASGGLINYQGKTADLVVIRNITERIKAEELINQSKKKYKELYSMIRLMADNIPDYIWAKDLDGKYLFVNKALASNLLFAPDTEDPIGKKNDYYSNIQHNQNSSKYWFTYGNLTKEKDQLVLDKLLPIVYDEVVYIKLKYVHLQIHKSPFFNEQGELIGVVGTARDITKSKQAEKELRENKERLELALIGSGAGLWDIYPKVEKMVINERWAQMLGYDKHDICSNLSGWRELVHPEDIEETDKLLQDHFDGKSEIYQAVYRMKRKNGDWRWILSIGKVIEHNENGDAIRAAGTHIDITERKIQEEKLRTYQEHLKLINKMMRHDLANNFAVIHSGYRLFERTGDAKYLKDIDAKALNGVELIGSLKQIEEKFNDPDQLWLVDLLKRARHISKSFSTLSFKFSGNAIVMGDEVIDSIIKNIFENSVKHGGATHVDIRTVYNRDRIELVITDNGKGLEKKNLENIFVESFTSGSSGNTGLGLYLVKKSMTRYSGSVKATLPPEQGLRITLSFPSLKNSK